MKILKWVVWTLLVWFLLHSTYSIFDGFTHPKYTADVLVVLGNTVNYDGSLSGRLKARLDCAIQLYKSGQSPHILVSGGLGKEGYWEAEVMKQYLMQNHIPQHVIWVDNYGNNTFLTAQNAYKLNQRLAFNKVIVVSQYFHITRCKMYFKKVGFKQVEGASPFYFEWRDFYALIREFFGFYYGLLVI